MTRKILPFIVLTLILVSGVWLATTASAKDEPAPKAPAAVPVKIVPVARRDMPVTIRAVGTVTPFQTVAIKSRLDSQIMQVKFQDGDAVKKGDTLFVLDDRVLKSQLTQAQANLQRDKAQLQNAKQQNERTQKLAQQGYATGTTSDETKAAVESGIATVAADQAAIDNIRVQLGYTNITAPIDGRTGTINVTVGNNVKANDTTALVTINQIKPILVQVALPQSNFDAVRLAMAQGDVPASAKRDGSDAISAGKLQYLDNAIDQGTGTFVTRAAFPNVDESLWPGMLVNLSITLKEDKGVQVVPDVAIQHSPTGDFVFAIIGGKSVKKPVAVARMQDGFAVIAKGLEDTDQVVTDGQMSLKDGSVVSTQ
ncbi:MAG: efflux transporter periplasmic adaptor subunit [Micavibrio sp.]|nr:efflux transporter periplasmic adaptor subunit [Micavibrio sp.]